MELIMPFEQPARGLHPAWFYSIYVDGFACP